MLSITRQKIDDKSEHNLLIGLISSTKFCKEIIPILDSRILKTQHAKLIANSVITYFNEYNIAPETDIIELAKKESKTLDENEAAILNRFLSTLNDELIKDQNNEMYLIDNSILYIKERGLDITLENARVLLDAGKIEEAEHQVATHKEIAKITTKWVNPFEQNEVNKALDYERSYLFQFPGQLGELAGPFERGFFIGFLAPFKRGKTWWLLELSKIALMYRLKVVFISLEMDNSRMKRRIYKNIGSFISGNTSLYKYPVFDCMYNQDGSCNNESRPKNKPLTNEDGSLPNYSKDLHHIPCTACRQKKNGLYLPATWYQEIVRPQMNMTTVRKSIKGFSKTYGTNNLRLKAYPRFSANLSDIKRDLDILEYTENFVPDLIAIDYADILAPEVGSSMQSRDRIDDTWKSHARLASERRCMVATVSQSSKQSWDARDVRAIHAAEDYRKMANVDIMFAQSQTEEEKLQMTSRMAVVAHRDKDFSELNQVKILQNLGAGQVFIDSEKNYVDGQVW